MILFFAIVFLLRRYTTYAVPLPDPPLSSSPQFSAFNTTVYTRDVSFQSNDHHRTVLDIVWSCLSTTIACTWVSVHPNIPFRNESTWVLHRQRAYLMFFSILAPEFTLVWAFKQWRGAIMIKEAVNKAIMKTDPNPDVHKEKMWTTAHGHFLQMGGFRLSTTARENSYKKGSEDAGLRNEKAFPPNLSNVFEKLELSTDIKQQVESLVRMGIVGCTTSEDRQISEKLHDLDRFSFQDFRANPITGENYYRHETSAENWTKKVTLKDTEQIKSAEHIWEGVLRFGALKTLLEEGLIQLPAITEGEINDRSKGDAISKGVALLQLSWFVVQIFVRVSQGLGISELELTTACLAGMNSVMYLFWWSKPHDVRFPIVIRTIGVDKILEERQAANVRWIFENKEFDFGRYVPLHNIQGECYLHKAQEEFQEHLIFPRIAAFPDHLLPRVTAFQSRIFNPQITGQTRELRSSATEISEIILAALFSAIDSRQRSRLAKVETAVRTTGDPQEVCDRRDGPESSSASSDNPIVRVVRIIHIVRNLLLLPVSMLVALPLYVGGSSVATPVMQILERDSDGLLPVPGRSRAMGNKSGIIFYSMGTSIGPLLGTSSLAGALFGAMHCLAWNFEFPTHVERIMWRAASVGLASVCGGLTSVAIMGKALSSLFHSADVFNARVMSIILRLNRRSADADADVDAEAEAETKVDVSDSLLCSYLEFYFVARIILLAVAITSLRLLPPSTFDTIDWIESIPHI